MKEKSRTLRNKLDPYIPPPRKQWIYGLLVKIK